MDITAALTELDKISEERRNKNIVRTPKMEDTMRLKVSVTCAGD